MYDEILFPTDGSEPSAATLPHVISQAQAFDARVHVLYVVDTTYAGVGAAGNTGINTLRDRGTEALAEAEERLASAGVDSVTDTRDGDPYTEVVAYAEENVDMIVMGTRGRSGVDRYLLGSVTEKVVRTADVPVLTVRAPEHE